MKKYHIQLYLSARTAKRNSNMKVKKIGMNKATRRSTNAAFVLRNLASCKCLIRVTL